MKQKVLGMGMLAVALAFGMTVAGCASTGSASVPVNPQLIGTWLYGFDDALVEITFRPDNTATLTMTDIESGRAGNRELQVRNGGTTLINPGYGRYSGRLDERGNFIITGFIDNPLTFTKEQSFEVAGSSWVYTHPNAGITYTFAEDGTYTVEYDGSVFAPPRIVAIVSGVDDSGTYIVSENRLVLKPTGGGYISLNGSGSIRFKEAETYSFRFIDNALYLEGIFYDKVL